MIFLSVFSSPFDFNNTETVTVLTDCFIHHLGFFGSAKSVLIRKKRLNTKIVLKNEPKINETIESINTRIDSS